jgi:ABC-type dipeptide/oligopeptide/nickel transport system permease subunit
MTQHPVASPPSAPSASASRRTAWHRALRRPAIIVPAAVLLILVAIALFPAAFAGLFGHGDPRACDLDASGLGPMPGHPFGLDLQGCDVYANVIYGTQSSLSVGVLTTVLAAIAAVVVGTLAGLYGGAIDWILSRLTDVFLGFPFLLGAIVVLTSVGQRSVLSVSIVLALFGWPLMARLARGSVRSVGKADYVLAARTMGIGTWRIVTRYVLPNALAPVLVVATITVGSVIVAESSLTYLGIGLEAPAISWGLQLASASSQFQNSPHLLLFPSIFLAVTVLSIITLGDALRSTFDPKRQQ